MLSNIIMALQDWVSTPTGLMTLAIIFVLGFIVAFFMVVVVNNSRSELKQFHSKYDRDIEALELSLATQKKSFDSESKTFASRIATLESSNAELRIEAQALRNGAIADVARIDELSQEAGGLRLELARELDSSSLLSRGLFTVGRLLDRIIRTKSCEVRTYLVAGGIDDAGNQVTASKNITSAVADCDPSINLGNLQLEMVMQMNRDTVQEDTSLSLLQKTANAFYHDELAQLKTMSPLYFVSILYIRSLDLKLVITDFNVQAEIQVNEPDTIKYHNTMRDEILDLINMSMRTTKDVLILNETVAADLGNGFDAVGLFNAEWLNRTKGVVTTQAA